MVKICNARFIVSRVIALRNWQQTGNKLATQPTTQPTTSVSSSSSSTNNIINTTTTSDKEILNPHVLIDEWKNIDIEPLNNIGFTKTHLTQIASQNLLSAAIVQDSINAFAFDIQENNKSASLKGDPLNFFMGILRNGNPYAPPSNYESPQDKAMRLYVERIREIELGRVAIEKEAFECAFNDWFFKLSDAEKKNYLPQAMQHIKGEKIIEAQAKKYFKENIWSEELEKIKASSS